MDDDENYGGLKRQTIGGLKKYHGNYVKENQKVNNLMMREMIKGRGKPKGLKVRYEVSENDSMMDDQSMLHTSEEEDSGEDDPDKFVKRLMKKAEQGRNSGKRLKESKNKRGSRDNSFKAPTFANDYAIIPQAAPQLSGQHSFPSRNVPSTVQHRSMSNIKEMNQWVDSMSDHKSNLLARQENRSTRFGSQNYNRLYLSYDWESDYMFKPDDLQNTDWHALIHDPLRKVRKMPMKRKENYSALSMNLLSQKSRLSKLEQASQDMSSKTPGL